MAAYIIGDRTAHAGRRMGRARPKGAQLLSPHFADVYAGSADCHTGIHLGSGQLVGDTLFDAGGDGAIGRTPVQTCSPLVWAKALLESDMADYSGIGLLRRKGGGLCGGCQVEGTPLP